MGTTSFFIALVLGTALFININSASSAAKPHAAEPDYECGVNCSHGNGSRNGSHGEESEEHHGIEVAALRFSAVRGPLVFTIVILLASLSKVGFHHADFLSSKVPESCLLIIIGVIFGAIFHFSGASEELPAFLTPHEFFMFLLPPIILESAFSLHDRTFADNLGSVLLFAVIGTVFACFTIGLTLYGLAIAGAMGEFPFSISLIHILIFTALIVAVDPVAVLAVFQEVGVNHCLYFLVFGESLLNDGVTVVLYQVMQTYSLMDTIAADQIILGIVKFFVVCFGGLALGVGAGLLSAFITKFTTHVKVVQPTVIYATAYLGFLLAELFEFSGIISIIGCGLVQVQYAFHNISGKSRTTIKYFTKVLSTTSEILIFLFLGLAMWREHKWHTGFVLWTLFFCLVYRFLATFVLSFIINKLDKYRVRKIGYDEQFMIAYGGLRGAVAFSLVMLLDGDTLPEGMKTMFVTTTLVVIMFTVFVQGISIKPLVGLLQIRLAPEKDLSMYRELSSHVTDHVMAAVEDIIGFSGKYSFREKLENFEDKYIRVWLQIEPERNDSELKTFYNKIVLKEHFSHLRACKAKSMLIENECNIPHIDTEMYLTKLAGDNLCEGDDEAGVPEDPEPEPAVVHRRKKKEANIDVKGLRSLLKSQHSSRMLLHSKYDKNLTEEYRSSMANNLKRRHAQNRKLKRMVSTCGIENTNASGRPRSWSEYQGEECEIRKDTGGRLKNTPRAATLDLGKRVRMGVVEPGSPPDSPLDAVYEEDEEKNSSGRSEKKPLLKKEQSQGGVGGDISRRKDSRPTIERQCALDVVPMKDLKKKDPKV